MDYKKLALRFNKIYLSTETGETLFKRSSSNVKNDPYRNTSGMSKAILIYLYLKKDSITQLEARKAINGLEIEKNKNLSPAIKTSYLLLIEKIYTHFSNIQDINNYFKNFKIVTNETEFDTNVSNLILSIPSFDKTKITSGNSTAIQYINWIKNFDLLENDSDDVYTLNSTGKYYKNIIDEYCKQNSISYSECFYNKNSFDFILEFIKTKLKKINLLRDLTSKNSYGEKITPGKNNFILFLYFYLELNGEIKKTKEIKEIKDKKTEINKKIKTNKYENLENININSKYNKLKYSLLSKVNKSLEELNFVKYLKNSNKYILTEEGVELMKNIVDIPHNRIIYGAPGTGKSYRLEQESKIFGKNIRRITFYSGYTYNQFIGTYKPKPLYKLINKKGEIEIDYNSCNERTSSHEPLVTYEFVPGIFTEILVDALNDLDNDYCLIIEEINRSKADSVFGDFFQLLDRDDNYWSKYSINPSIELRNYLNEKIKNNDLIEPLLHTSKKVENNSSNLKKDNSTETNNKINFEHLKIPPNLYIWATMNSSDQGVYSLDTAFKRRWDFDYILLDEEENNFGIADINYNIFYKKNAGRNEWNTVSWNKFRDVINSALSLNDNSKITEDRLIAPFFLKPEDFQFDKTSKNRLIKEKIFINKILMYLFEDILKHRDKSILFHEQHNTFSDLVRKLRVADKDILIDDFNIFNDSITQKFEI